MLYTLTKVDDQSLREIEEEMRVRQTREIFLLFSLGSQFDHLIKQSLEKLGVFCLVADPARITTDDVARLNPKGMILSGGPASVYEESPPFDAGIFNLGIPVLGICLGFQLWAQHVGAKVINAEKREFGRHALKIIDSRITELFVNCSSEMPVLENHGDVVLSNGIIKVLARTENSPVAAARYRHLWGVQFHPECTETKDGPQIFSNFCFIICGAKDRFPAEKVAEKKIKELREKIGDKKVILALSGGSDSATVAYLLKKALADKKNQLRALYIKGVDRPDDELHVIKYFANLDWLELKIVEATDQFLDILRGRGSWQGKRGSFKPSYQIVLDKEIQDFGASYIAQGTLYTDLSESGGGYNTGAKKAVIKTHHNTNLLFSCAELTPLADCVKDSGRNIGRIIGVPEDLLVRHPFPGPGVAVRIEGEITAEKLAIARKADGVYIAELRKCGLYHDIWQAGAVLIKYSSLTKGLVWEFQANDIIQEECEKWKMSKKIESFGVRVLESQTTCVKGDDKADGQVMEIYLSWGKENSGFNLPYDFLKNLARRLTNEIPEVGAVVLNIRQDLSANDDWAIALWAVWSVDGFTARAAELPYNFLRETSKSITLMVPGINNVVYRLSDKPPATIEWG